MALDVLGAVEDRRLHAEDELDRASAAASLDQRDRALLLELVYGVLQQRSLLDWRLNQVADRPVERLPPPIRWILRLGAYQILWLTKIPPRAAVHETVELVRDTRLHNRAHWTGFVNAVLRALLRSPEVPLPDPSSDPSIDPIEALSLRYSCPAWMVERWIARLGVEGTATLCRQVAAEPPLTLRVNTIRFQRDELLSAFQAAGIAARPTEVSPDGVVVERGGSPAEFPLFREGGFYIEDEAAQLIPRLLGPNPGERILDACAAPGGKTTHLAALMRNEGEVIALDRSVQRLRLLRDNLLRMGAINVKSFAYDLVTLPHADRIHERSQPAAGYPAELLQPFDRILLDAPCSAFGVLRRHPEAKWQKSAANFADLHRTQFDLLSRTSRLLRPGGVIVYSTCSTEPEETIQVIDRFSEAHPEFVRESVAPELPPVAQSLVNARGEFCSAVNAFNMDGFFAARLRRSS
ncbi:MAG TPA: 16S rRNA (cytosine(967)-C(5))-methyltransferase RsmB [Nitrospiraceae bacterium]|nr:16S rRNA (cytosine(967)-C(5))-methyltransferase RsmB [Nitrospiraceae bacterium]